MATIEFRAETSQGLIIQAETELRAGNSLQASEMGWEAAASAVKAVAERRGWRRDTDADLYSAIGSIARLSGDPEFYSLFNNADALHQNIYEGWLSDEHIAHDIERVKRLLAKLDAFMDAVDNGAGG